MTNVASLSIHNGNSTFHNGINNANDLMFLGIGDLHDAYRWYNDHVAFVPHNAIRVLRVAQATWTFTMNTTTGKHSAMNSSHRLHETAPETSEKPSQHQLLRQVPQAPGDRRNSQ
jgi:hypothetical protein